MKNLTTEIKDKYTVKRLGSSPYFTDKFLLNEMNSINKIEHITMCPMDSDIECNIAITNTHIKLNRDQIDKYPQLKLIIHSNSGFDNIDIAFVKEKNIPIIVGNEIRANAVANFILTAFFNYFNPLPKNLEWDKKRAFNRPDTRNLKVLIIGMGHVGKILINTLDNVVDQICVYDPFKGMNQLPDIAFDVVIPVASLNPTSKHFIDKKFLEKLAPDFLIINASRGELINTIDLCETLKSRPNAFAYLDVFEKEPNDFKDFIELKNINLSSHVAGVFNSIEADTIKFEIKVIEDFCQLSLNNFNKKYLEQNLMNKIHRDAKGCDFLI